jgi:hypothetical protein
MMHSLSDIRNLFRIRDAETRARYEESLRNYFGDDVFEREISKVRKDGVQVDLGSFGFEEHRKSGMRLL